MQTKVVSVFSVFHSLNESKGEVLEVFREGLVISTGFPSTALSSVVLEGSDDHFLLGTADLGLGGIVGGGTLIPTIYHQK